MTPGDGARRVRVLRAGLCVLATTASLLMPEDHALGVSALVVALAVGVPHGALDLEDALSVWPRLAHRARVLAFAAAYGAMVAVCFAGWHALPVLSLSLFLGLAVLHFGQSDLQLSERPGAAFPWFAALSRGLAAVGLPLLADPGQSGPVLAAMTGGGLDVAWMSAPWIAPARAVIVTGYLAGWMFPRLRARRDLVVLAEECCLLLTLTFTPPLLGFSLYFGLFHGPAHLRAVFDRMQRDRGGAPLRPRIARAWWTCALALAGVAAAGLWWAARATGASTLDGLTAGLLVMLASLTVPHAALVAAIEARRRWRVS